MRNFREVKVSGCKNRIDETLFLASQARRTHADATELSAIQTWIFIFVGCLRVLIG